MVMDKHVCPYGLKALDLLKSKGFSVRDHHLTNREAIDAFKKKYSVKTTPQTFIGESHIGGYEDLKKYFGDDNQNKTTYKPIIAIFSTTFLMAIVTMWAIKGTFDALKLIELFITFSMCVLAIFKLQNLEAFSLQFLGYDLLAQRWVKYCYIYPFVEMLAGVAMIGGVFTIVAAPAALFISTIGAISVFKAVYIEKRELKCACVGGNSNVPLGFISLTENLMMMAISIAMLSKYLV